MAEQGGAQVTEHEDVTADVHVVGHVDVLAIEQTEALVVGQVETLVVEQDGAQVTEHEDVTADVHVVGQALQPQTTTAESQDKLLQDVVGMLAADVTGGQSSGSSDAKTASAQPQRQRLITQKTKRRKEPARGRSRNINYPFKAIKTFFQSFQLFL